MVAEPLFVDTNILLEATDVARRHHSRATLALERHPALVMSAQVAREYLVVCTRPMKDNGLGLSYRDAADNLAELRAAIRLLSEERPLLPALLSLLEEVPCHGKAIHDAAIVAAMRAHGIHRLLTLNVQHFERFQGHVIVEDLEACDLEGDESSDDQGDTPLLT